MTGPVKPEDVVVCKTAAIPDAVFAVFNALIAKAWNGRSARVLQSDAVDNIAFAMGMQRQEIYKAGYLDIEPSYRAVGWKVTYDKPVAYAGEDYPPYWNFEK